MLRRNNLLTFMPAPSIFKSSTILDLLLISPHRIASHRSFSLPMASDSHSLSSHLISRRVCSVFSPHHMSSVLFSALLSRSQLLSSFLMSSELFSLLFSSSVVFSFQHSSDSAFYATRLNSVLLSSPPLFSSQVVSTHPIPSHLSLSQLFSDLSPLFSTLLSSSQLMSAHLMNSHIFSPLLTSSKLLSSELFSALLIFSQLLSALLSSLSDHLSCSLATNLLQNWILAPEPKKVHFKPFVIFFKGK